MSSCQMGISPAAPLSAVHKNAQGPSVASPNRRYQTKPFVAVISCSCQHLTAAGTHWPPRFRSWSACTRMHKKAVHGRKPKQALPNEAICRDYPLQFQAFCILGPNPVGHLKPFLTGEHEERASMRSGRRSLYPSLRIAGQGWESDRNRL